MTWQRGYAEVAARLTAGDLEVVTGSAADGRPLLDSALRLLTSADREAPLNPEASFVLAYDAARKSCSALLAQQGLRTRSTGHHVTTEQVVRAQFGGPFAAFSLLRRRRVEIEYPRMAGDAVTEAEARNAVVKARAIYDAAEGLVGELSLFRL